MTITALDRVPVAGDAGRVTGERQEHPDPEVPERARRRTFTAQYKLEVLAAYDAAGPGEKGAILRREGLYSSHIVDWRRSRDRGSLAGPARPRGRPAGDPRDAQIARLRKEKAQLEQELARARFVVMRVRFPSPAPPKSAGHSPGNGAATVPGSACGPSSCHICHMGAHGA
jgi:transposase-like protein